MQHVHSAANFPAIPAGAFKGTKTVYVSDPDGISLQLLELHKEPLPEA
jgi:hypothetical protein